MGSFISLPPQNYNNKAVYFHTLLSILSIFQKMNRGNSSDSQQFFGFAGFVLFFFFHIRTRLECFDDTTRQNCTEVAHFQF